VKKVVLILFPLLWLSACGTMPVAERTSLENAGGIFLYVQPFAKEAEGLRFSLAGVSVVAQNGEEVPVPLAFKDLDAATLGRQRLLAFFPLPPGEYSGFSFRVKSAELTAKEGVATLAVPEGPVRANFNFRAEKKRAEVIQLALNYGESTNNGAFSPVFRISVPERPIAGLTGYVSNYAINVITVFNKMSMEVSGAIATGSGPRGITLDQLHLKAYVAISDEDAIEVIDMLSGNVINRGRLAPGDEPREIALTADGGILLTANYGTKTVSFVDPSNLIELQRVEVGDGPCSLLIDNTGSKAYVFNHYSNTMSVIDIMRRAVSATVPLESSPVRGQFNRKGDRLYVIFSNSPYLSVMNVASLGVVRRQFVGMGASSMKVDTKTDLLYIGKRGGEGVEVYNPFSLTPSYRIPAEGSVSYMTMDGEENNFYLLIPGKKIVSIINPISRKVLGGIDVGEDPQWVTMMGER
jgi:YVTN family beta-propeller protein